MARSTARQLGSCYHEPPSHLAATEQPRCPGARPYESHEVTLSIDPEKLGVVAMAPFDGKAAKVRPKVRPDSHRKRFEDG